MKNILRLFVLVFSGVAITTSCSGNKERTITELPAVPVQISEVSQNNQARRITASGSIEAENSANVSTRMMGYITGIHVKMGQKVQKGQLLATLNSSDLTAKKGQAESGILQAQSAFNNAKKDYERFVALFEQNSATQKEMDDMTTHLEMARAGLEMAKQMKNEVDAQFAYTNITAPFSGVVTGTFAKEGDMASPGMPIISLEGSGKLEARVMVSESEIAHILPEMEAEVSIKSLNKTVTGKVSEISSSARNTGGQYFVKIDLTEAGKEILPGMFVNVVFQRETETAETGSNTILIPENAIVREGQLQGIYVVSENNTALLRWLRLGKKYGNEVEVLSGLTAREKYIQSANGRLFNGIKITTQ